MAQRMMPELCDLERSLCCLAVDMQIQTPWKRYLSCRSCGAWQQCYSILGSGAILRQIKVLNVDMTNSWTIGNVTLVKNAQQDARGMAMSLHIRTVQTLTEGKRRMVYSGTCFI